MDSAADSLLALSNTAVALAAAENPEEEDDRSSSLSELEDEGTDDFAGEPTPQNLGIEADSEAETERLEESPDKLQRKKSFGATPSKLAHSIHADQRPEIESLTESAISSPVSSHEDSDILSDVPVNDDEQYALRSPGKRKRDQDEEQDEEEQERSRRRRTGSIESEEAKSDESDVEDDPSPPSREATLEPIPDAQAADEDADEEDEDQNDEEKADSNEDIPETSRKPPRTTRSRGKDDVLVDEEQEAVHDADAVEESDEAEPDDAEAAVNREEEQAKRMAAMEALTALERHFAALRDRLYDERIATINQELAQLNEPVPSHPELLRQLEAVKRYRDEKFEIEQKLLVYKVGALKNNSVGERSQIHSAFFQTIRDMREKHLERLSEHFYRIQRDRYKSDSVIPSFTIPFPEKRSKQITQQTAYNKEVSIISGFAKYVGFPAAPELPQSHKEELEEDLQKMGVSADLSRAGLGANLSQMSVTHARNPRPVQRVASGYASALAGAAADEQFLEKNPWANAQHPMHRLGISRQNSNRSPMNDFLTPAQQRTADPPQTGGSASTIPEKASGQASSALNTPHDNLNSQTKMEGFANHAHGVSRLHSVSPLDTRRVPIASIEQDHNEAEAPTQGTAVNHPSSPLAARIGLIASPSRPGRSLANSMPLHTNASPAHQAPGITAGSGYLGLGRLGLFS